MEQRPKAPARQALFALGTPRTPIVAHRSWRSTLDKAVAAVESGKAVVAILGPEGVGKSTLLQELAHIAEQAPRDGITRRITVLDDADKLGGAIGGHVPEPGEGCLLLAGRPELALELSMLGPDAAIISMGRIWQADIPAYLEALCQQTGQTAALIEPAAAEKLSAVSSGLPGVLTAIARTAALVGAAMGADRVGPAQIDIAARLYQRREALPRSPAELAALLEESEPGAIVPAATGQSGGPKSSPRTINREILFRPSARSMTVAVALGCAILAGGALWFTLDTGRQSRTPENPRPAAPQAAAPVPGSAPAAMLPPSAPPRVVVSYAAGSVAAQARAAAVTGSLRTKGFPATEPLPIQGDQKRPAVGFFFPKDQAAAASVAAAAGQSLGAPELIGPPRTETPPEPGTIDIFVADDHKIVPGSRSR